MDDIEKITKRICDLCHQWYGKAVLNIANKIGGKNDATRRT